jgi:phosphoglycolate phosphatase-like HAD superfamily hydrolase
MKQQPKLYLWDIDGTLISVGGAGERALIAAIFDCFGIQGNLSGIDYSGRTDRRIAHMLHEHYGIEKTDASLQGFLDSYISHLEAEMQNTRMEVLPGIQNLLESIEKSPELHQGLLTGNLIKGSEIKLKHFNLWRFFRFGAFSNLSINRNELAGFALMEAKKATGISFFPQNVFVIGDTPHDIECGKVINAKTVAVATGRYSMDALRACQPDFLFEDFSNPRQLLDLTLA